MIDFVDALFRDEHFDEEWDEPKSLVQVKRERAFAALDTLLSGDDAPVSVWIRGFMGDRRFQPGPGARTAFVHGGLRDLINWQQGVFSRDRLVPFAYISNGKGGHQRKNRDQWQQDALGGIGDKP